MNRDNQGGALSRRPQGSLARPSSPSTLSDPFRMMEEMQRRMDAMFTPFFGISPLSQNRSRWSGMELAESEPDVDIYENDSEYVIHAALPGIEPQDIKVEATEDSIMVTAENRSPFSTTPNMSGQNGQTGTQMGGTASPLSSNAGQGQQNPQSNNYTQHRQSRYASQSRYEFAYTLPTEIKPEEVRANFRNGRLELTLPKRQPTAKQGVSVQVQAENGAQSGQNVGIGSGQTSSSDLSENPMQSNATGMAGTSGATTSQMGTGNSGQSSQEHQRRNETSGSSAMSPSETALSNVNANAPKMTEHAG